MKTYIALFRGINVGGNNILPMRELVAVLESIGLHNIKTYIQSGNVIFQGKAESESQLSNVIGSAIKKSHGFEPRWCRHEIAAHRAIQRMCTAARNDAVHFA